MERGAGAGSLCSLALVFVVLLTVLSTAAEAVEPPWCGTPEPDAAANLPDGSEIWHPNGSFPHIPYYAIGCTLESIAAASNGRMTVEVIGKSALGRDTYLAVINALDTPAQRQDFQVWQEIRRIALTDPRRGQELLQRHGGDVKVPVFVQGGIHGNEYEGVDASMQLIERLATTPYGIDPEVDTILDHAIAVFNVIQNPDGRIAGTRANGNGFDLNRDYITQSQPETQASVKAMLEWLAPDMLDQHGYTTPTLIEAPTKPHNPSVEYDLWLEWNQARLGANESALNATGLQVQRPINDWCIDGGLPPCAHFETPGPAVAQGWDDWGPFYAAMYAQQVGLNASTVEMCSNVGRCGGRSGARLAQYVTGWSTMLFDIAHRRDLLFDQLEIYRRGVENAARPACCPAPFGAVNNWMTDYPTAHVIPIGRGQRSDPEANRLVRWLLFNGIEVTELKQDYAFGSNIFENGSYVVWMNQARRGLAHTALSIGEDISSRINILYAPPGAWSHGYLWGAEVVTIPRDMPFAPQTNGIDKPNLLIAGGVEPGTADRYALKIDSVTAVRTLNTLVGNGVPATFALASFTTPDGETLPAGSAIFAADPATKVILAGTGRENGLRFRRVRSSSFPPVDPIDRVPRIAVLTDFVNQDVWSLRSLGFPADPVSTAANGTLDNPSAPDPLASYDVVFNASFWPAGATARTRLTAFFNRGGGYIGAGSNGANFLGATSSGQLPGLVPTVQSGGGQSGIFYWQNTGGADSPIVGAFPSQDAAIMDPPTWFSSVPATASVDGRLLADTTSTFAAGLWRLPRNATAAGAAIIVHAPGAAAGSRARITAFSMNPLYRADPEREWPAVAMAAYWADQ